VGRCPDQELPPWSWPSERWTLPRSDNAEKLVVGAVVVVIVEVVGEVAAQAGDGDAEVAGERGPPAFFENQPLQRFDVAVGLGATGADAGDADRVHGDRAAEALGAEFHAIVREDALELPSRRLSVRGQRARRDVPVGCVKSSVHLPSCGEIVFTHPKADDAAGAGVSGTRCHRTADRCLGSERRTPKGRVASVEPRCEYACSRMNEPILELLEEYGSLGYEQITALVGAPPQVVRGALAELLESEMVDVVSVGDVQGHKTEAAVYWRLTEKGRQEIVRRRSE
jgi:hypothetical protein